MEKIRELDARKEKLSSELARKMEALKKDHIYCSRESRDYNKRFNPKTGRISMPKTVGCGEYFPEKDFLEVSIEDIEVVCVSYDAGWGDDDEMVFRRIKDYYKICPKCHKMIWNRFEIVSESEPFKRRGDDDNRERIRRDFVQQNWKPIVKIEKN